MHCIFISCSPKQVWMLRKTTTWRGGDCTAQWTALLLLAQRPQVWFSAFPNYLMVLRLIDCTMLREWTVQSLTIDWTHLVQVSDKLVLQKREKTQLVLTKWPQSFHQSFEHIMTNCQKFWLRFAKIRFNTLGMFVWRFKDSWHSTLSSRFYALKFMLSFKYFFSKQNLSKKFKTIFLSGSVLKQRSTQTNFCVRWNLVRSHNTTNHTLHATSPSLSTTRTCAPTHTHTHERTCTLTHIHQSFRTEP